MRINIPEDVAQRLEQLAQEQHSSVGDVLKTLLNRYALDMPASTLAALAQNAKETGLASAQPVETAARSREILVCRLSEATHGQPLR